MPVTRSHGQLSSCAISEKTNDSILRKVSGPWTDIPTDVLTDKGQTEGQMDRKKDRQTDIWTGVIS